MPGDLKRDNRQAVRVTSKILFACKTVPKETYQHILDDFNNGISLYNREELADIQVYIGAQSALSKVKEKDEDLGAFLQHLDGKINLLLKKVDNAPNLLDSLALQRVNIGANGLAFWTDTQLSHGDIIEMHLVLQPEHIFIDCFGSVIDCMECKGGESPKKYRVSVSFQLIMDEDREELVHYNFRQQSLALKRRRIEKEDKDL